MFGSFHGLPVHALVLHAVVVLAPLSALVAFAFAVPKWRGLLKWPLVVVAVLTVGGIWVARESGEKLRAALGSQLVGTVSGQLIQEHETYSTRLFIASGVLVVVAAAAVAVHIRRAPAWTVQACAVALVVVGAAVLLFTYQTGEAGAKAVWNPTGTVDYSG